MLGLRISKTSISTARLGKSGCTRGHASSLTCVENLKSYQIFGLCTNGLSGLVRQLSKKGKGNYALFNMHLEYWYNCFQLWDGFLHYLCGYATKRSDRTIRSKGVSGKTRMGLRLSLLVFITYTYFSFFPLIVAYSHSTFAFVSTFRAVVFATTNLRVVAIARGPVVWKITNVCSRAQ